MKIEDLERIGVSPIFRNVTKDQIVSVKPDTLAGVAIDRVVYRRDGVEQSGSELWCRLLKWNRPAVEGVEMDLIEGHIVKGHVDIRRRLRLRFVGLGVTRFRRR